MRHRFRNMKKIWIHSSFLLFLLHSGIAGAQVTGGRHAMSFLRMANAPHVSALGGIQIASPQPDISFAIQNPALMRPSLHNELGLSYNSFYAGIQLMNLNYGYSVENIKTDFFLGVQYLNYGDFLETDAVGNSYGNFKARDYAITIGASREYKERWRYGMALKWAHSSLYDKTASALLTDVGVSYVDTANHIVIGLVAKNIGFMTKKYNPSNSAEPLPFDLQLGISKRLKHVPLRLMATVHHLYEWDIRYANPADREENGFFGTADSTDSKSYFADKLFRHFIFAAEFTFAKRLSVIVGYNHLRRGEMKLKDKPAMAGFSLGASLYLNKFQVHFARSYYHVSGPYNEIGLNFSLNKLFDIGKTGNRIGWNQVYGGW